MEQQPKPGETMLKAGDSLTKGCGCIVAGFFILLAISFIYSMFTV
jgi:hypothetical protein